MKNSDFKELLLKLKQLENRIEWFTLPESTISTEVLLFTESLLKLELNEDIKTFFQQMNGGCIGIEIFSLEKCIIQTLSCREIYTDNKRKRKLKNSLIISDDGTGNPIMISKTGTIYIFHHDDSTYEIFDKTLGQLLQSYITNLEKEL